MRKEFEKRKKHTGMMLNQAFQILSRCHIHLIAFQLFRLHSVSFASLPFLNSNFERTNRRQSREPNRYCDFSAPAFGEASAACHLRMPNASQWEKSMAALAFKSLPAVSLNQRSNACLLWANSRLDLTGSPPLRQRMNNWLPSGRS